MFSSLALCVAAVFPALSADKDAKPNPKADAARQQIADALRAEAAGDNDRRASLLAAAIRTAPDLPEANWQQAQVEIGGKWLTLDAAAEHFANDDQLTEYRQLRDAAGENPKLLRGLARWCLKNNLSEAAKLHYSQLLVRDDTDLDARKEAIQRLDLQFINGSWMSNEALKAEEEKYRAIEAALRRWRPRLKQLQLTIDTGDFSQRQKAIQELQRIADPQVIIVLESFQMDGGDRFCEEAAKRLSQFPQLESTQALTRFAVLSPYLGTRDIAKKALKDRPKHDYAPLLMSGLLM